MPSQPRKMIISNLPLKLNLIRFPKGFGYYESIDTKYTPDWCDTFSILLPVVVVFITVQKQAATAMYTAATSEYKLSIIPCRL